MQTFAAVAFSDTAEIDPGGRIDSGKAPLDPDGALAGNGQQSIENVAAWDGLLWFGKAPGRDERAQSWVECTAGDHGKLFCAREKLQRGFVDRNERSGGLVHSAHITGRVRRAEQSVQARGLFRTGVQSGLRIFAKTAQLHIGVHEKKCAGLLDRRGRTASAHHSQKTAEQNRWITFHIQSIP